MISIDPKEISTPKLHHYLLGAIGPRPIAFASTLDREGKRNLAPFSFFNVFSANPPIMVFSPSRSGRTNTTKDTYNNIKNVPEVVINVVTYDMVHQMSLTSSAYPPEVDEFLKAGFTPIASELVKPYRVKESPIQFECKVIEVKELGNQGGAGNLVICEVLKMHIDSAVLNEDDQVDQTKIDLVARMGGNWYCRASGSALFEIQKPITTQGVGIDVLPDHIKNSDQLSGNELGMLGNILQIPSQEDIDNELYNVTDQEMTLSNARQLLHAGEINKAYAILTKLKL